MVEPLADGASPRVDVIAAIDEILQIMYWLRDEGLAADVTPAELVRWVGLAETEIQPLLTRMREKQWVRSVSRDPVRYALTDAGLGEGGRRFADEFSDLTRQAHGECGDPDGECQRTGDPADCAHRAS